MRQLSLLTPTDDYAHLAGLLPAIRGAMRRAAGAEDGEGRKALVDSINRITANGGVRLTTGNSKAITKDILDKWLSPSDASHPPSITAIVVFCLATGDMAPLKQVLKAAGLTIATEAKDDLDKLGDIMTAELLGGGEVPLPGIGKLCVKSVAARTARNPKTGEAIVVPARKKVFLRVGKELKEALQ